jgi:hypothetical protein
VHILVIVGRICMACSLFFSLTAFLPIQDMSSTAQTHLGAAHTHFGCCCYARFGQFKCTPNNACFGPVMN